MIFNNNSNKDNSQILENRTVKLFLFTVVCHPAFFDGYWGGGEGRGRENLQEDQRLGHLSVTGQKSKDESRRAKNGTAEVLIE